MRKGETEPNGMEVGKHQSNSNKLSIISSVCHGLQSPEKRGMLFHAGCCRHTTPISGT